jgi:gluconolactonase
MAPTSGLLDASRASVFFDGTLSDPQLDHPEGLAVHRDGSVWCGGERGQIFRVDPEGTAVEEVASTGGFCLGMAFGPGDDLFVCDLKHAAVFRVGTRTGRVERFAEGAPGHPLRIPNSPAFDGRGELWYGQHLTFANGLAVGPDGRHLYVAETFANRVSRIAIGDDGAAGEREDVAATPGAWPDGLAFDVAGNLYVGCYEPSQVLRVDPEGRVEVLFREWSAHLLAHPTNLAFRGTTMFTANLGRWHLTRLQVGAEGLALPPGGWR